MIRKRLHLALTASFSPEEGRSPLNLNSGTGMAIVHTKINRDAQGGEQRVYQFLSSRLPNTFQVWHHVRLQNAYKDEEIDFVVLHKLYGVWVIEVKDWGIEQIHRVAPDYCEMEFNGQLMQVTNPCEQVARKFGFLRNRMQRQKELLNNATGKLVFPINELVVFTRISAAELQRRGYDEHFTPVKTLTAEMIDEKGLSLEDWEEIFEAKRKVAFKVRNNMGLTEQQVQTIARVIYPVTTYLKTQTEEDEKKFGLALRDLIARSENLFDKMWSRG